MATSLLNLSSPIKEPEAVTPFQATAIPKLAAAPSQASVNQQYATPEARVADQLNTLLNQNSPYITTARKGAYETANQLGLLSSSMAAGAGQRAAIQSALPIAQQDASFYSDLAKQQQSIRGQEEMAKEAAKNTAALSAGENTMLAKREQLQNKYNLINTQLNNALELEKIAAGEKENYASMVNNIMSAYNDSVNQISLSDLTAQGKAIAMQNLEVTKTNQVSFINQIYGQKLNWKKITWSETKDAAPVIPADQARSQLDVTGIIQNLPQ